MTEFNVFPILTVIFVLFKQGYSQGSYRINVTGTQIIYWRRSLPYIQQFTGKRCTKASPMAQDRFCVKRCHHMYYYIPDAPFKNYRYYNKTTKDCQPKAICPSIFTVQYNSTLNKCVDLSTGDIIPSVDAKPYKGNDTYQVEFVCVNGYVGMHKGKQQCICNFGWKTKYFPGVQYRPRYLKCNQGINIWEYLPQSLQIYYDPLLDNVYPHPADPQYWPKILILYLKDFKYSFMTSIWPYQVQLTLLTVPTQDLIRYQDLRYVYFASLIFLLIILISLYQKVKNTRTMKQIVALQNNNT